MLNIIGLGLNINNITEEIKQTIKESDKTYLESYTSYFYSNIKELEEKLQTTITPISRIELEQKDKIIKEAKQKKISLLIIGDPFSATTHSELYLRTKKENIKVKVIHNVSIINAITNTGLEIYKFGKTASIVYPRKNWLPKAPYNIIEENKKINAHTIILLDIITTKKEIEELDPEKIGETKKEIEAQIKKTYDNNEMLLMTPNQAIKILKKIEEEEKKNIITEDTKIFVCSKLQQKDEKIITGTIKELEHKNFGTGPHTIILPEKMHFIEEEFYNLYKKV